MAIDSYSLCPGGRGKKIRFCCPDRLKDLEQIDAMIEGEQFAAGLSFVDKLLQESPDCACLTEAKCLFQRTIGLWEEAYETASVFAAREPKNVVAQTELATAAALLDKPQEAISALVDSIENVDGDQFPFAIIQAMLTVGSALYESGRLFQAIAVAKQLQAFAPQDRASNEFLYRCLGDESVPLMLKEQVFDVAAPDDFPQKAEYDAATRLLARGQWKRGRAAFEALLPLGERWPNLFRNLGIVELWFANDDKARAYLERYLATPGLDPEDAVDMEVFQTLLVSPTWDDVEPTVKRTYTLVDFDAAYEKLLSSRLLLANSRLLAAVANADVPPKTAFNLLTGPLCESTDDLKLDDVPFQFGYAFVYGKQTDRAARLEIFATSAETSRVEETLKTVFGAVPPLESAEEQPGQGVLWTTNESLPRFQFRDGANVSPETLERLFDEHLERFADKWIARRYGVLGGKSPKETLAEPNGTRRVEALIRVVCSAFAAPYSDKIAALLRARAGLDAPKPIAPPESFASKEDALAFFRQVPLWRWNRLEIEKCKTDALVELLQIANLVAPRDVKEKFATETLARPAGETRYEDRAIAYSILIDAAVLAQNADLALERIAEATRYANETGNSDAQWNVLEVVARFRRQELDKVRDLSRHIFAEHQDDRQAMETMRQFFAQINAAAQANAQYQEEYRRRAAQTGGPDAPLGASGAPFGAAPQAEEAKPSNGLWTPGGDDSASGSGSGGSKLWLPD